MSSRSTRFASAATALALLAGCHGAPPRPAAAPAAAAVPAAAARGSGSAPAATAGGPPADATPVPERAAQQYAQALALMKAGRSSDAELEFKQLALAYPGYAGPEVNLGILCERSGRLAEAEAALEEALKRNPDDAIAEDELGIVERKLGKFTEAEAAYQRTMTLEPNYAAAYFNLGVLYDLYLGEPQKALDQFEHYLALAGDNKQVAGWVIELRKRVGAQASPAKKESA